MQGPSAFDYSHGKPGAIFTPVSGPAPMDGSLLTNLTHYYYLGEASGTRSDSIGTLHFSTINGSPTQQNGFSGKAVGVTPTASLLTGNTVTPAAFSISIWIYVPVGQSGVIMGQAADGGDMDGSFELAIDPVSGPDMNFRGTIGGSGGAGFGYSAETTNLINQGAWNNCILTFGAGNVLKVYLNGDTPGSITGGFPHSATSSPIQINGRPVANFNPFTFYLDEVAMWSRDITASEVASMWNAGAGKVYVP